MGILTNTAAPLSTAGNMDKITGEKKLKDLFRVDKVLHDNFLFKLHHQANFAIILFGVAFIFGMNYLNGNAIECKGGGDFEKQYCWLHGAGHIDSKLSPQDIKCKADQNTMTSKTDERHTHYYLWVPFVMVLCLAVIKAPRVLWKEVCERGMIAGAVGETEQPADKIAERFKKLKRKANKFHWAFFICELLNILSVVICFVILDTLFAGNFMEYGSNFAALQQCVQPVLLPHRLVLVGRPPHCLRPGLRLPPGWDLLPGGQQVGLRLQDGASRPGQGGRTAGETQLGRVLSAGQDLPEPEGNSDREGHPGAEETRK